MARSNTTSAFARRGLTSHEAVSLSRTKRRQLLHSRRSLIRCASVQLDIWRLVPVSKTQFLSPKPPIDKTLETRLLDQWLEKIRNLHFSLGAEKENGGLSQNIIHIDDKRHPLSSVTATPNADRSRLQAHEQPRSAPVLHLADWVSPIAWAHHPFWGMTSIAGGAHNGRALMPKAAGCERALNPNTTKEVVHAEP